MDSPAHHSLEVSPARAVFGLVEAAVFVEPVGSFAIAMSAAQVASVAPADSAGSVEVSAAVVALASLVEHSAGRIVVQL